MFIFLDIGGVLLGDEEEGVVHELVIGHEGDIVQDLLADAAHIVTLEQQELIVLAVLLQVHIFQAVLHRERLVHLTINDAALEVELAELVLHLQEQVVHQQDVHFSDVLHLHRVDAVNLCNQTFRILSQMV